MTNLYKPARLRTTRAIDTLIEEVRTSIGNGTLNQGDKIPTEKELSKQFGVSQPTVREALRVLESIGLIQVFHGRGAFVTADRISMLFAAIRNLVHFENVGLLDLLTVREMLGRESAFLAAQSADDHTIRALRNTVKALATNDGVETVEQLVANVTSFQKNLADLAHFPMLTLAENFLSAALLRLQTELTDRKLTEWVSRSKSFQPAREAIVDAIERHDPPGAHAAMQHLLDLQREMIESDPILRSLRLSDPKVIDVISTLSDEFRQN